MNMWFAAWSQDCTVYGHWHLQSGNHDRLHAGGFNINASSLQQMNWIRLKCHWTDLLVFHIWCFCMERCHGWKWSVTLTESSELCPSWWQIKIRANRMGMCVCVCVCVRTCIGLPMMYGLHVFDALELRFTQGSQFSIFQGGYLHLLPDFLGGIFTLASPT